MLDHSNVLQLLQDRGAVRPIDCTSDEAWAARVAETYIREDGTAAAITEVLRRHYESCPKTLAIALESKTLPALLDDILSQSREQIERLLRQVDQQGEHLAAYLQVVALIPAKLFPEDIGPVRLEKTLRDWFDILHSALQTSNATQKLVPSYLLKSLGLEQVMPKETAVRS